MAVDTLGLVLTIVVHCASMQDQHGGKLVLSKLCEAFARIKIVFADSAYGRNGLPTWAKETYNLILQTVLRPVKATGFVVLPKRWIVERTFAWLGRCRRNSKDYEQTTASSQAIIEITMIALMAKRLANAKS